MRQGIENAGHTIGEGHTPYVIAELSVNRNGNIDRAVVIVKAANNAGVDAVKLQTYTADTITMDADDPGFKTPRAESRALDVRKAEAACGRSLPV